MQTAEELELSGRSYEAAKLRVKLKTTLLLTLASIFGGAIAGRNALSGVGAEAGAAARGTRTAGKGAAAPALADKFNITVIEHENTTILLELSGENGTIHIAADMTRVGDRLILDRMDIAGPGAGSSSISELRDIARAIGKENGASEVVVRGERRNTGMGPGRYPREIIIKVY